MHLMFQGAISVVKDDRKPTLFHPNYFYRHEKPLLDELHVRRLEEDKGEFPIIALFLDTTIHQTRTISHSIMSVFISTVRPFN